MPYFIVERKRRPDGAIEVTLAEPVYPEFIEGDRNCHTVDLGAEGTLHIHVNPCPFGGNLYRPRFRFCLHRPDGTWGKEVDGNGDLKAAWRRYVRGSADETHFREAR